MCWEDIVIQRRIKSKIHFTATSLAIPGNGKRIGFWLATNNGGNAMLNIVTPDGNQCILAAWNGILGGAERVANDFKKIGIEDIGDAIYGEFLLTDNASVGCIAVETWIDDPPEVARKAMEP